MRRGFTILELLLTVGLLSLTAAAVFLPLSALQGRSGLQSGTAGLLNVFRRAQAQALAGYFADSWGIHLSDADGCALPASQYHLFRGSAFTSATDTIETFSLPNAVAVTALAIGGGCDVKFSRYGGSTTSTGTVTLTGPYGATTLTINGYGRITQP